MDIHEAQQAEITALRAQLDALHVQITTGDIQLQLNAHRQALVVLGRLRFLLKA